MKAAPYKEEILHLVYLFLKSSGLQQEASAVKELYDLPAWIEAKNPLFKKGLTKIIKQFIRKNNKVLQYFTNRSPQANQQVAQQEEQKKPRKGSSDSKNHHKKSSWMQTFEEPKLLEDIEIDNGKPKPTSIQIFKVQESTKTDKNNNKIKSIKLQIEQSSQESDVQVPHKKKKAKAQKKNKKIEKKAEEKKQKLKNSSSQQSEDEEQIQHKEQKAIKKPVTRVQQKNIQDEVKQQISNEQPPQRKNWSYKPAQQNGEHKPRFFSRINAEQVVHLKEQLKDNTFEAKFKYGQGGDEWGKHGYEKLKHTRGDSFKKTKSKLKNAAFQSGGIDPYRINSVKIL